MRKFLLSASLIASFALYAFLSAPSPSLGAVPTPVTTSETSSNFGNPAAQVSSAPAAAGKRKTTAAPSTQTPASAPTPTLPPAPARASLYSDGIYKGSSADAYYGYVQVQTTIQNGRITDVRFLQYPNDRRTSQYINGQAMPYLKSEAIQVQSANVDIVSGATDTSMAFRESLSSALAQARG